MSLAPGSRVGIYQVVELLGVGGMGEVYRAIDSRLDRAVAIKTLPAEFAADPERLARFEREAKTLAQLNHPHIASIYGIEPGTPVALAMELAEGDTLADRLRTGPLPIDDVLAIARQIADGLEHAHAKGIVHRDLKPANIKVGLPNGNPFVKILDFGLAKAMSSDAANPASAVSSPTITSPANLTRAGVVLGTAAYMAPEQARGRAVDHRADIWAFGCVLFEMLSRRRAFEGDEVADVMARVIQSDPDWTLLPASTPGPLREVLRRCLRKDAHQRLHAIADVRIALDDITSGASADVSPPARVRRAAWPPAVAGATLGAAITAAAFLTIGSPAPVATRPAPIRYTLAAPDGFSFYRSAGNNRLAMGMSPDNSTLAAVLAGSGSERSIFLRHLGDTTFRELAGTDGAVGFFWAPDSTRLAFSVGTNIRVASVAGGTRALFSLRGMMGGSWSTQDVILTAAGNPNQIMRWDVSTAASSSTGMAPAGVVARTVPRWLPDGESFLFIDATGPPQWTLRHQRVTGEVVDLKQFESFGGGSVSIEYLAGYLLLSSADATGRTLLTAQRFDPGTSRLLGEPTLLASDLNVAFAASDEILVFGDDRTVGERFEWLDARGQVLASSPQDLHRVNNFDLSPDERLLVFQQANTLQLHDLERGVTSSLSVTGNDPIWSPDGREIVFSSFSSSETTILRMPAFGGAPTRVLGSPTPIYPEDWSADGRWLAIVERGGGARLVPLARTGEPLMISAQAEGMTVDEPRFSPDGRWIAYGIAGTGVAETFLSALPPTGERWQLSVGGGGQPRWRADGRAVYYLSLSGTIMVVDLDFKPGAPPRISAPRRVVDTGVATQPTLDQFDVSRDGTRFMIRRPTAKARPSLDSVHVIVNWQGLLNAANTRPQQ